ncbi:MAG: hypothetical protein HY934_08630 [Candidatus Firestonebacteria bacterium]|nr:hypothetical protein [Candidatus Firestonebacteria bacterium]
MGKNRIETINKKFIILIILFLLLDIHLNCKKLLATWRNETGEAGYSYANLNYSIGYANLVPEYVPFDKVGLKTGVAFWYADYPDGNDSISEFLNKITAGKKPCKEAGIDCSSQVCRSLKIARRGTATLQEISLPLLDDSGNYDYSKLKKGDILIKYPSKDDPEHGHSMYYDGNGMAYVSSAVDGVYIDPSGNEKPAPYHNRVMYVNYVEYFTYLNKYDYNLSPRTLFPMFTNFTPEVNEIVSNNKPEIKVTVKSGTNIVASSIIMKIDGNQVTPILLPSTDAKEIVVSYTPTQSLSEGEHTVYIYAKNKFGEDSLEDDNTDTMHNLATLDDFLALA